MNQENGKIRDIERVIQGVQEHVPQAEVAQLQKKHAADDDGIWWFQCENNLYDIQVENSWGMCPFLIETDIPGLERRMAHTVEEAINMIVDFLRSTNGQ